MTTSLKSFAAFVVALGILGLGAAPAALAKGNGSSGGGKSGHTPNSYGMSKGERSPSSGKFDKYESHRYDHDWDHDSHYRYGGYPWSFGYSSHCYPYCSSYCYTPNCCYECAPQYCVQPEYCQAPCEEYCPPAPICYEQPCYSYCPEYFSSYCHPSYCEYSHYRPWYDKDYDHYKDRDYDRDKDRDYRRHEENSKMRHDGHEGSHLADGPRNGSSMNKGGKSLASSGGHGSRR